MCELKNRRDRLPVARKYFHQVTQHKVFCIGRFKIGCTKKYFGGTLTAKKLAGQNAASPPSSKKNFGGRVSKEIINKKN